MRADPIAPPTLRETPRRSRVLRTLEREIEWGARRPPTAPRGVVREEELRDLPDVVRRYFDFMGVVGRPRVTALRIGWRGEFRLGPDRPFRACEAWQIDRRDPIARFFYMRTTVAPGLVTFVRDTYVEGRARMLAKLFDGVPIVDERGPALDTSELVTYLNDAVMLAPSMLVGGLVRFAPAGEDAFDVTLVDRGVTVSARVDVDPRGAPRDFVTTDRFGNDPFAPGRPFVRARWSTPVVGFAEHDGRHVMEAGCARWHFPGGSFDYARLTLAPGGVTFEEAP